MLLTIDIGNTNIAMGVFSHDKIVFEARLETNLRRTVDQYASDIYNCFLLKCFDLKSVSGAIISSVVPEITLIIKKSVAMLTGIESMVLGPGIKSGLNIRIDNPAQLGADLVAGAVAAVDKYPLPCLIMDLGTATKISVVDKDGIYRGCTISPGVAISLNALSSAAALLPAININASSCPAFGTNTVASMQSGVILGTASMLDGLCDKIEEAIGEPAATIVATGGLSENIINYCKRKVVFEPRLLLYGLKVIYEKNI